MRSWRDQGKTPRFWGYTERKEKLQKGSRKPQDVGFREIEMKAPERAE